MFKCKTCGNIFKYKSDFKRHLNRKTPCKKTIENYKCKECGKTYSTKGNLTRHIKSYCSGKKNRSNNSDHFQNDSDPFCINECPKNKTRAKKVKCKYCDKTFTSKTNMYRHARNVCKIKMEIDKKEKIYQKLLSRMENMENKMDKLAAENKELKKFKEQNINVTNNNNNIINNNQVYNVHLVAFGEEDRESIKNSEIFNMLRKGFSSVPELVKAIHFNKERPENHNIYISNMRDNYVMVFDGDKWELRDRAETIENLFDDGRNFLVARHNDMKHMYNDKSKLAVKKFDRFNYDINHCPEKKLEVLNDIKLILYNKRDMSLKRKTLSELK